MPEGERRSQKNDAPPCWMFGWSFSRRSRARADAASRNSGGGTSTRSAAPRAGARTSAPLVPFDKKARQLHNSPTKIQLQVDYDVACRLAAADQHGAFGGRLNRVRLVVDSTDDEPGLAAVAHPGPARPSDGDIARLGEVEEAVKRGAPADIEVTPRTTPAARRLQARPAGAAAAADPRPRPASLTDPIRKFRYGRD